MKKHYYISLSNDHTLNGLNHYCSISVCIFVRLSRKIYSPKLRIPPLAFFLLMANCLPDSN